MEPMFSMKLIGAFLIVYGLLALIRKQVLIPAIAEVASSRGLLLLFASIELAVGLAIVFAYEGMSLEWTGVVWFVGIMMVIEAILYLAFPVRLMQPVIQLVNKPVYYTVGGIVATVLGAGMLGSAFGWW